MNIVITLFGPPTQGHHAEAENGEKMVRKLWGSLSGALGSNTKHPKVDTVDLQLNFKGSSLCVFKY